MCSKLVNQVPLQSWHHCSSVCTTQEPDHEEDVRYDEHHKEPVIVGSNAGVEE